MTQTLSVLVETNDNAGRSAFPRVGQPPTLSTVALDATLLADNLRTTLQTLEAVLEEQPSTVAGFELDEIEFSLTVNASGGFELVGKASAGIEAGIKIKLKRRA